MRKAILTAGVLGMIESASPGTIERMFGVKRDDEPQPNPEVQAKAEEKRKRKRDKALLLMARSRNRTIKRKSITSHLT